MQADVREALIAETMRAAERLEGVHIYPVEGLAAQLRDQVVTVLMCEAEPHVVADAIGIAVQAANRLAALEAARPVQGEGAAATRALVGRLRQFMERATPPPWYTLDPPWLPSDTETSILAESPDPHIARFICDFDLWALDDDADADKKSANPDADAALIVAAINALPELLDLIERLSTPPALPDEGLREAARDLTFFPGNRVKLTDDCRTAINQAFLALAGRLA